MAGASGLVLPLASGAGSAHPGVSRRGSGACASEGTRADLDSVERLTTKHILPQKELRNKMPFEVVGSLGNLLLVNDSLNTLLGDKDFESKKRILRSDGLNYDIGGVLDAAEWTKDSIVARTRLLAERAYDDVWMLPL
ncbi:HNH endonuclease family protein [Rathayibacter tritici]